MCEDEDHYDYWRGYQAGRRSTAVDKSDERRKGRLYKQALEQILELDTTNVGEARGIAMRVLATP